MSNLKNINDNFMKVTIEKGFTLIELMIVVAIIGILSAIAIFQYQNFIVKTQLTSAVAELNGARPQYELIMNEGSASGSRVYTVANMFFAPTSRYCKYDVHAPVAGVSNPALECELTDVATVIKGESIFLNRDVNGKWNCSTTIGIPDKFKPIDCM